MLKILVVPSEYKKHLNPIDGYFLSDSQYKGCTLKKLFWNTVNKKYLVTQITSLITSVKYLTDTVSNDHTNIPMLQQMLITNAKKLNTYISDWVETYPLPYAEDMNSDNPVEILHSINLEFIKERAELIVNKPDILIYDYNRINPDTGIQEYAEHDYDASSYADGVWRPEDLFANTARNRANPYWVPMNVEFDSSPEATGVGHKYNNKGYNHQGQFPAWQKNKRHYDRDSEEFHTARTEERAQRTRGYDMSAIKN